MHDQAANPCLAKGVELECFLTKKACVVKYSCANIVPPGGLGALNALFEGAALVQRGKIGPFTVSRKS